MMVSFLGITGMILNPTLDSLGQYFLNSQAPTGPSVMLMIGSGIGSLP
jgi:hypothetical protein